jgi:hypothetical protein
VQDRLPLLKHPLIRESQDREPSRGQDAIALPIALNGVVVYRAVHFDNEARRMTVEVNDEAVNDLLAAEVKPAEAASPYALPKLRLSPRHLLSHLACERLLLRSVAPGHDSRPVHILAPAQSHTLLRSPCLCPSAPSL